MTREDALKELEECDKFDTEVAHSDADDVLCALLRSLGYNDVVDRYEKIEKWYA